MHGTMGRFNVSKWILILFERSFICIYYLHQLLAIFKWAQVSCCKEELTIQAKYFTNANIIQIQIHRPLAWKPGPIILIADGIWLVPSPGDAWTSITLAGSRAGSDVPELPRGAITEACIPAHDGTWRLPSPDPQFLVGFSRVPQCWCWYN